ncbi:hypothetical protein GCM10009700_07420 [Brevibacterium sanguinis]
MSVHRVGIAGGERRRTQSSQADSLRTQLPTPRAIVAGWTGLRAANRPTQPPRTPARSVGLAEAGGEDPLGRCAQVAEGFADER